MSASPIPQWLDAVLTAHASSCLDNELEREKLAAAILGALPRTLLARAIRGSADAVLHMRGAADSSGGLGREIGNNGAASAILALTVGEEALS